MTLCLAIIYSSSVLFDCLHTNFHFLKLGYPTLAFPFTNSYDKLKLQDKRGFISLFKLMDLPHCTKSLNIHSCHCLIQLLCVTRSKSARNCLECVITLHVTENGVNLNRNPAYFTSALRFQSR